MRHKFLVLCLLLIMFWPLGSSVHAGQICGKFDTASAGNGAYKVQNNIWGADTIQCVSTVGDTGFTVDVSEHNNSGGMPASYPSIWRGCHWQDCTPGSGMPIQASAVNDAVFSWQFKPVSSGTWNATAEAWFKTNPEPGAPDGTELMIWLNHRGSIQPGGSKIDTVNLAGTTWDVWFTGSPGWNFVTYRRVTPVNAATIDMKPFMDDAMARGYLKQEWYLMDMEAGFEIWQGGAGLQTNAFSFDVNGDPNPHNTPNPPSNLTYTLGLGDNTQGTGFDFSDACEDAWTFGFNDINNVDGLFMPLKSSKE